MGGSNTVSFFAAGKLYQIEKTLCGRLPAEARLWIYDSARGNHPVRTIEITGQKQAEELLLMVLDTEAQKYDACWTKFLTNDGDVGWANLVLEEWEPAQP